jgi:hypothetical protein
MPAEGADGAESPQYSERGKAACMGKGGSVSVKEETQCPKARW